MSALLLLTQPSLQRGAVIGEGREEWQRARDKTIAEIKCLGGDDEARAIWKKLTGYHQRSLVETEFSRFKGVFGAELFSKHVENQEVELLTKAYVLNQMTKIGMPKGKMI